MRNVILDLAVTLDGFIEGPNGEIDWLQTDSGEPGLLEFLEEIDTIVYGRISYVLWGNFQPDHDATEFEKTLWRAVHSKKKVVVSTSLPQDDKATWISDDITTYMNMLKAQEGKGIWLYGGASLISTFMNLGLIDKYRLGVYPVILGQGKPLFIDIQNRVNLVLQEAKPSASGMIMLTYVPRR
jgi:dihydrofolate reductase